MKKLLVILLLWTSPCWATTYYVRSDGHDTADGTQDSTDGTHGAWKSVGALQTTTSPPTLAPDDVVAFRCGDTFYPDGAGVTHALYSAQSGISGHPIVFTSYGTGALPVLKGSMVMSGLAQDGTYPTVWNTACTVEPNSVWINGNHGGVAVPYSLAITATGGHYTITWNGTPSSSLLYSASAATIQAALRAISGAGNSTILVTGTNPYNIILPAALNVLTAQSVDLTGGTVTATGGKQALSVNATASQWYWTGNVLSVYGNGAAPALVEAGYLTSTAKTNGKNYITWKNLAFVQGGNALGATLTLNTNTTLGMVIQGCTFTDSGFVHIGTGTLTGDVLVDGCTFAYSGEGESPATGNGSALDINGTSPAVTVQNCYFTHVGDWTGSGYHDHGIYHKAGTLIWRYNTHVNGGAETGACVRIDSATANNCQVYYNLFSKGTGTQNWGVMTAYGSGHVVYNNTFYGIGTGVWYYTGSTGLTVKNNIFHTTTYKFIISPVATGLVSDRNCFYGGPAQPFTWSSTACNLAAWQGTPGFQDANSISSDPNFNYVGTDFRLRPFSPCINAGVSVSLTQDFIGFVVPRQTVPCIGAYEWYPGPPLDK